MFLSLCLSFFLCFPFHRGAFILYFTFIFSTRLVEWNKKEEEEEGKKDWEKNKKTCHERLISKWRPSSSFFFLFSFFFFKYLSYRCNVFFECACQCFLWPIKSTAWTWKTSFVEPMKVNTQSSSSRIERRHLGSDNSCHFNPLFFPNEKKLAQ